MEKFTASEVRDYLFSIEERSSRQWLIAHDTELGMLRQFADLLEAREKAVPIGWVFQHEETGLMTFCENDGVNNAENFAANNPRHVLCGPAFTHPAPADAERLAEAVRNGLIDALRHQRQIDEDGEEVGVSRQAIDEAAAILSALAAHSAQAQPQDIRCQRNSPAGCGCTTTCLALAQPAARTCSDERPCVNCFADQGGCLGPAPETVRQRKEQRAVEIAAAISTRHEFSRHESPLILDIVRATLTAQETKA